MPHINPQFRPPPPGAVGEIGQRSVAPSTPAGVNEVEIVANTTPQARKPTVRHAPKPRARGLSIHEPPISMGHEWQVDPDRIAHELGING